MLFCRVLMLLMRFNLLIRNAESPQNVLDLGTDLNLGMVGDELGGCTMATDVILKCVHKMFVSLHSFNVSNQRFSSHK